jgi:hypothetical protein
MNHLGILSPYKSQRKVVHQMREGRRDKHIERQRGYERGRKERNRESKKKTQSREKEDQKRNKGK